MTLQAMDEVHVAQFAGLIRLLSKQNNRQVTIAVHERELFDYLALKLSPAYDGDELITIELGERATEKDQGTEGPHRAKLQGIAWPLAFGTLRILGAEWWKLT
jgi:hypothetical protein